MIDAELQIIEKSSTFKLKEFKKIFRLAFPERPEDKLDLLTAKVENACFVNGGKRFLLSFFILKVANVEKTDGKIREQHQQHQQQKSATCFV